MHPGLATGIVTGAPWVGDIFTDRFQKAQQWRDYLLTHFGGTMSVNTILNRGDGWSAADFQALYIACWIFYPLEKGSYMIPLTSAQRANVKGGYGKLSPRPTSHLHKHGRSAGAEWKFLKGYTELLVQLEGGGKHSPEISPHLFLKNEGHPAVSVSHIMAYFHKLRHGTGMVRNDAIDRVVKEQAQLGIDLGISDRNAENYSKGYQKVLSALGLPGATVTAQAAVVEMFSQCRVAMANKGQISPALNQLVSGAGLQAPMAENGVGGLDNAQMGAMIDQVLLPFSHAASGQGFSDSKLTKFFTAMLAAEADLKQLAAEFRADAQRTGQERSVRYFQEIVVGTTALDAGLAAGYEMLNAAA
jgi:hypothetical protein